MGCIEQDSLGNALNTLVNAGTPLQNLEVPIYYLSDVGRLGYLKIEKRISRGWSKERPNPTSGDHFLYIQTPAHPQSGRY